MRPKGQAAGVDGWLGVLLRWAPFAVAQRYGDALRRASLAQRYPEEWSVNLVTHIPKPENLAEEARRLVATRDDAHAAEAPPARPPRKTRSDAGVPKGPRGTTGGVGRIGALSLMRFRHGIERQVPESLRAEVLKAEMAGYDPWSPPRAAGETVHEIGRIAPRGDGAAVVVA